MRNHLNPRTDPGVQFGSLDLEAHWGVEALREWAFSGSRYARGGDRYFDNISRKWAQNGDKSGDTGGVLGSQLDWLHLFSQETSNAATGKMYSKFIVPSIYLWVFTGSDSLIGDAFSGGRFRVTVPILGTGNTGPPGLHRDFWDGRDVTADQTHHFAGFFAAGFKYGWASDLVDDNVPDQRLARVATAWRDQYNRNPAYYGEQIERELKAANTR